MTSNIGGTPPLSDAQIATAARQVGFAGNDLVLSVAVALAESSGITDATNHNTDGSTDYGLWQINSVHSDLLNGRDWTDPIQNAAMAKSVHDTAGSWRPWSTFNSGAYLPYYARAVAASTQTAALPGGTITATQTVLGIPGTPSIPNPFGGVSNALKGILSFLKFVADPTNWLRVAEFLAGLALVSYALWQFVGDTKLGSQVEQATGPILQAGAEALAA